ncbi:hypothetical protein AYL99_02490 [Fonsecaea erecta]|uniref:CENP-V/GFA domain-containing protein n=1 Tax=Fonsecaea erecta TaxID=1367422 RepID=A0A178ZVJ0_9EURO|nr:hypothetical protein AYL99_02490 [Fonsecaea erecta]OAP63263.1 hypothetical protein AYL99_02490 [Fonsecaea erecta]
MPTGGCLCGEIRYEFEGEPLKILTCHCAQCHKSTSTMFSTGIFLLDKQFKLLAASSSSSSLEPATPQTFSYPQTSDGSLQILHFCPVCSTTVWRTGAADKYAGMLSVQLGTLDDPEVRDKLAPSVEYYASLRTKWVPPIEKTEQAEGC